MSEAVLISIKPEWCELIASGKKTVEVRKTRPRTDTPFKCYIYCTRGSPLWLTSDLRILSDKAYNRILDDLPILLNGKVIGEFVCDRIQKTFEPAGGLVDVIDCEESCLTAREIISYAGGKALYFWHISELKIYDTPKELREFIRPCPYGDVSCYLCEKSGYGEDMHIDCFNAVTSPPQSWCYVDAEDA